MSRFRFRIRVYEVAAKIPRGKVASYGLIAILAGRPGAARAVGMAMRDVPDDVKVPAHRVIKSDGGLAPKRVFAGQQRAMLEKERVKFKVNGKVNMARCEWER